MPITQSARRRGPSETVTLEQVAQQAGVHPMTVSRALQGSEKVAPATRELIQRVARELNYTPNIVARALAMGKTKTIAVITGSINEHFYANLLHLLEIEISRSDYKLFFLRSRDLNRDLLPLINAKAVDGIISIDALPLIRKLIESPGVALPPCVYAGVGINTWPAAANADVVAVDLKGGVREALQAMLASGCQRIAYLVPAPPVSDADERYQVYEAEMETAGRRLEVIDLETDIVSDHDLIRSRFIEYIELHGHPDGLLCQNDEMAIAAYRALRDLNLSVPHDVQVVGCDGIPYTKFLDTPLSTIVQPAKEMCVLAWQFLQRRLNDPDCPRQETALEAKLVVRESLKAAV